MPYGYFFFSFFLIPHLTFALSSNFSLLYSFKCPLLSSLTSLLRCSLTPPHPFFCICLPCFVFFFAFPTVLLRVKHSTSSCSHFPCYVIHSIQRAAVLTFSPGRPSSPQPCPPPTLPSLHNPLEITPFQTI